MIEGKGVGVERVIAFDPGLATISIAKTTFDNGVVTAVEMLENLRVDMYKALGLSDTLLRGPDQPALSQDSQNALRGVVKRHLLTLLDKHVKTLSMGSAGVIAKTVLAYTRDKKGRRVTVFAFNADDQPLATYYYRSIRTANVGIKRELKGLMVVNYMFQPIVPVKHIVISQVINPLADPLQGGDPMDTPVVGTYVLPSGVDNRPRPPLPDPPNVERGGVFAHWDELDRKWVVTEPGDVLYAHATMCAEFWWDADKLGWTAMADMWKGAENATE